MAKVRSPKAIEIVVLSVIVIAFISVFPGISPTGFVATNVSGCQNITAAGEYALNTSISNSGAAVCINVTANNVIFDCQMRTIDGTAGTNTVGVLARARTNVTLRNCVLTDWGNGTLLYGTNSSFVQNITFSSAFIDNGFGNNAARGIHVLLSANNTIENNTIAGTGVGIISTFSSNLTIINNTVNSADTGFYIDLSNNVTLRGNKGNSDGTGIGLNASQNITVVNNTMNASINYGVYIVEGRLNEIKNNTVRTTDMGIVMAQSNNNSIDGNIIESATTRGIFVTINGAGRNSFNNTIKNNRLTSNGEGINVGADVDTPTFNSVIDNIINGTTAGADANGINVDCCNNTIAGNIVIGAINGAGIRVTESNTTVVNNTLSFSLYGLEIEGISDINPDVSPPGNNIFRNNTVRSNSNYGVFIELRTVNNHFSDTITNNNSIWDFYMRPYENTEFSDNPIAEAVGTVVNNLTLGPAKINFAGRAIALTNASIPAGIPSGYSNMSKFVNITNTGASGFAFLNMTYTDSEISSITESSILLIKHNTTHWLTNTSSFSRAGSTGSDAAKNYVFANITSFSIFALVGQPAPASSSTTVVSSPVRIKEEAEEVVEELFLERCDVEAAGTAGPTGAAVSTGARRLTSARTAVRTVDVPGTSVIKQRTEAIKTPATGTVSSRTLSTLIKPARVEPEIIKSARLNVRTLREIQCTISPDSLFNTVKFNVAKNLTGAPINIKAVPEPETAAPGATFEYVEISHAGIESEAIRGATIDFDVEKSWLLLNNIDPDSVVLRRFSGGEWENFTAVKINETDTKIFYRASAPGLSLFAIGGEAAEANRTCPVCPKDTAWSACGGGRQSRVAWTCDEDTNFQCKPVLEGKSCAACTAKCAAPTKFSACTDNRMSRTVQKCGEETGLVCKNFRDSRVCGCPAENEDIIAAAQAAIRTAEKTCKDITVASLLLADALTAPDCDLAAIMAEQARLAAVGAEGGCLKAGMPWGILVATLLAVLILFLLWKRRRKNFNA